ncbi:MAG: redoxin domain-containing protein [Pirellulales bacterium]
MKTFVDSIGSLCLCLAAVSVAGAAEQDPLIGRQIADFTLKDFRGQPHALADFQDKKLLVVAFLGTECPLAKLYGPRMQELCEEFASRGVAFLGINSNRQDAITEVAAHARTHGIAFPILKDLSNVVADQFGATRTPEIFVLDEKRVVRYHGRVDGQYGFGYGVGYVKPKLDRRDLAVAVEELLAGKEVGVPMTEIKGCLIGRVREADDKAEITYSNQIARLFEDRCVSCHREGQIAPFAMTNYEEVAGWGEMIDEVVRDERMPPWHANPKHGDFSNDAHLSQQEKELISTWVAAGCPEGNRADLPEPRKFTKGWMLPREPDQVIYLSDEPVEVMAEGTEPYRHYTIDPGFTEDKWVQWAECMPGNPRVVHHIIVFVKPPWSKARERDPDIRGFHFLSGFAPGTRPMVYPAGTAKKIPAGSQLVFQMHYTPCGSPQLDRSGVGLIFMDKDEVTHLAATTNTADHDFAVPPHDANYRSDAHSTFDRDTVLLSMFPHMHLRGKSFRYEATYPDGRQEVLLDVPKYDFNWQNNFILAEPKLLPKGTQMHCTAYFDNSADNLANPDPTEEVRFGPQTWHEMMIGWYDVSYPVDQAEAILKEAEEKLRRAASDGGEGEDDRKDEATD